MTTLSLASALLALVQPSLEAHKGRRGAELTEEGREYPDDDFFTWAKELLEGQWLTVRAFIQHATEADMGALIAFFMSAAAWPAHRRAFYGVLHTLAMRMEKQGLGAASAGFAAFVRERYTPAYTYMAERPAQPRVSLKKGSTPPPSPAGLPPILELSREEAEE